MVFSLNTHYCSRRHQRADWKHRHRAYCKETQSFPRGDAISSFSYTAREGIILTQTSIGFSSAITTRDNDFLKTQVRVAVAEARDQFVVLMDNKSLSAVTFELDFSVFPARKMFNLPNTCSILDQSRCCYPDELSKTWDRSEDEQGSVQEMVLVCIRLPIGRTSNILFGSVDISEPESLLLLKVLATIEA